MKIQMLKILLPLALLLITSGCTLKPVALNPRTPMQSRISDMSVTDARVIDRRDWARGKDGFGILPMPKWVKPAPDPAYVIGDCLGRAFVLANGQKAADLIAGIIANRYPTATVRLVDFRSFAEMGVWMNNFTVLIDAEVKIGEGVARFTGRGENAWSNATNENFELGFQRALEDFAAQINAAPADLSRVVK
jgi:hypothetical protein